MASSMTGYGRQTAQLNGREIAVEIKSVNHRYFDFNCRVPRAYGFLEERLKKLLLDHVSRGKVDLTVNINQMDGPAVEVTINHPLLHSYLAALREVAEQYNVADDISVSMLARNPDLFAVQRQEEDAELLWQDVQVVLQPAMDSFLKLRQDEGERLCVDLRSRLDDISGILPAIETASERSVAHYRAHLQTLLDDLLGAVAVDEGRLSAEVALFADKLNITEELVRLRSHIVELGKMLNATAPSGRKMDFLLQEMNREINTIGSKSQLADISMLVVQIKAELEKIREQVQNLE